MQLSSARIVLVMLWELWRVSRWDLLMRGVGMLSLLLFLFTVLRNTTLDEFQQQLLRALALIFVAICSVFSTIWMNNIETQSSGFTFRLGFARPVSTFQLVAIPSVYCMVTTMLFYFLGSLAIKVLFGVTMPLVGPALFLGCSVSIFVSIVWSSLHSLEKIIGVFGALLLIIGMLTLRFHAHVHAESLLLAIGQPDNVELAWYDYLVMGCISIMALIMTVVSVSRQRCGEGWSWSRPLSSSIKAILNASWLKAVTDWLNSKTHRKSFRNSIAVQFWFEVRRSIAQLYTIAILGLLFLALISLAPLANSDWAGVQAVRVWIAAILLVPLVCQLLVVDSVMGISQEHGRVVISKYDATRPLRCDQIIAVKLVVVACWSLIGLLWMLAMAAIHSTLAGHWHHWQGEEQLIANWVGQALSQVSHGADGLSSVPSMSALRLSTLGWPIILGSAAVLYFTNTALLMTWTMWMSRYRLTFMVVNTVVLCQFAVGAIAATRGWSIKPLWLAYAYLIPSLIIAGMIAILLRAVFSRLLSGRYLAGVLVIWLITITIWANLTVKFLSVFPNITLNSLTVLPTVAVVLGILTSAASAPLAYAAFRHQ